MDLAVALRIERNRAAAARWYIESHRRVRPDHGATYFEIAGGIVAWSTRFGSTSLAKAAGVGLGTPVTADDLDRIEAFFRERDVPARVAVCPFTHPSLFALLAERRYAIVQHDNVLARPPAEAPRATAPGVVVERVSASRFVEWANIVREGMEAPPGDEERGRTIAAAFVDSGKTHAFVATRDGEIAGAGGLLVDDGVATLFAASTLSAHRRRGVQGALIAARLEHARALGCDLATAITEPGSDSQRNLERRFDFRVGYTGLVLAAPS